jgi:hypothetical protein
MEMTFKFELAFNSNGSLWPKHMDSTPNTSFELIVKANLLGFAFESEREGYTIITRRVPDKITPKKGDMSPAGRTTLSATNVCSKQAVANKTRKRGAIHGSAESRTEVDFRCSCAERGCKTGANNSGGRKAKLKVARFMSVIK